MRRIASSSCERIIAKRDGIFNCRGLQRAQRVEVDPEDYSDLSASTGSIVVIRSAGR
jgi:hypothetical protein